MDALLTPPSAAAIRPGHGNDVSIPCPESMQLGQPEYKQSLPRPGRWWLPHLQPRGWCMCR